MNQHSSFNQNSNFEQKFKFGRWYRCCKDFYIPICSIRTCLVFVFIIQTEIWTKFKFQPKFKFDLKFKYELKFKFGLWYRYCNASSTIMHVMWSIWALLWSKTHSREKYAPNELQTVWVCTSTSKRAFFWPSLINDRKNCWDVVCKYRVHAKYGIVSTNYVMLNPKPSTSFPLKTLQACWW